ncbi:MAG: hypothetical protein U0183_35065 [Polyangiaceae bacterium]
MHLSSRTSVWLLLASAFTFSGVTGLGCSTTEEPPPTDDAGTTPDGSTPTPDGSTPTPDGSTPDAAKPDCTKSDDCASKVCDVAKGKCLDATCEDGAQNQDESDIDCGGAKCKKCDTQKKCKAGADCTSKVCKDGVCQAPTCTDTTENGTESDVDCGGAACGKCVDGKNCKVRSDCQSDVCTAGKCATPSCNDGAKNGTDTDIDCGGPACPRCGDGKDCLVANDCTSGVCADKGMGLKCQPPTCMDGVKNQDETDVDCGGATCAGCGMGQACLTGSDCASQGCNYNKVCAAGRSCVAHYGGDTCGAGGEGGIGAEAWEDCCTTAPVTVGGNTVQLDKYQVTAGRMRVFLESIGYDVRGFVQGARAAGKVPVIPGNAAGRTVLEPSWDLYLPTSFNGDNGAGELSGCAQRDCTGGTNPNCTCTPGTDFRGVYTAARRHIGGFIFNGNAQTSTGCFAGAPGTHAYRFNTVDEGIAPEFDQNVYDTKSMQCVDYLVAQAFCVWDGGRLETLAEWQAAWGAQTTPPWRDVDDRLPVLPEERGLAVNRGDQTYWGCRFPWATDAAHPQCGLTWDIATRSLELANYRYSYEFPKLRATQTDYISFISAPGRTRGRGPGGHADLLGNNFELTSTVSFTASYDASGESPIEARHRWSGNGSWEVHGYSRGGGSTTFLLNKYGKLGLRCVKL